MSKKMIKSKLESFSSQQIQHLKKHAETAVQTISLALKLRKNFTQLTQKLCNMK